MKCKQCSYYKNNYCILLKEQLDKESNCEIDRRKYDIRNNKK